MTGQGSSNTGSPDVAKGRTDWRSNLARAGLIAKGILYLALGFFAIDLATGVGGESSEQGAIELIASQPYGRWILAALTLGLFALAAWRAIVAFTGDPVEGSEIGDRVVFGVKAALYVGTAVAALSVLIANWNGGSSGGGGGSGAQEATGWLMGLPLGPWLVGIAGAIAIGYALYSVKEYTVDTEFMSRLNLGEMRDEVKRSVESAGRAGYAGRAVVISIVGVLLIVAAVQHDPSESGGLSRALKTLAVQPWGRAVLWVVAAGLILFGLFSFAEARYRRAG
jgi:hypothetical protein